MKTTDEIMEMVREFGFLQQAGGRDLGMDCLMSASQQFERSDAKFDEIRAALTANMGWQGMDSAPKDGTRILLCADGLSTVGFWIDEQEDQVDVMGADAGFVDVDYQNFWPGRSFGAEQYQGHGRQPTGWMPRPPPPEEGTVA